jgi:hypothetical protein
MRRLVPGTSALALALALGACDAKRDEAGRAAPDADGRRAPGRDRHDPVAPHPAGTAAAPGADAGPGSPGGYHLDDPTVEYAVDREPSRHKGRALELLLRSTPPGAVAAVDGEAIGPTPTLWAGEGDGRPREFTFVLPGYATARYRFVPTHPGVVHGTLERLKLDDLDAGP